MKKLLLILMVASSAGAKAQTIDSLSVVTTGSPNKCFVRVTLPSHYYKLTRIEYSYNPAGGGMFTSDYLKLYFNECSYLDKPLSLDTLVDVGLGTYADHRLQVSVGLDTNTTDSACDIRSSPAYTDTAVWNSGIAHQLGTDNFQPTNIQVNVYPNPASEWLYIQSHQPVQMLQLYSADGRLAMAVAMPGERIDVRHLSAGSYIAVLETSQAIIRQRVFIHP